MPLLYVSCLFIWSLAFHEKVRMFDLVMIGSSIFEFWGNPNFGELNITNRAIRSTTSQSWSEYNFAELPKSKGFLIYCGSNDLIFGNPDNTVNNVELILKQLNTQFPNAKLGYFSIIKCPQKCTQYDLIDKINQSVKALQISNYQYFEANDFIDNNPHWYLNDGLHLNQDAYLMLQKKLTLPISQWLK